MPNFVNEEMIMEKIVPEEKLQKKEEAIVEKAAPALTTVEMEGEKAFQNDNITMDNDTEVTLDESIENESCFWYRDYC